MSLVRRSDITTKKLRQLVDKSTDLTVLLENPVLNELVMSLRDRQTMPPRFRELTKRIGELLVYEMGQILPYAPLHVTTPMDEVATSAVTVPPYLVQIARAGQGLQEGGWLSIPKSYGVDIAASRSHGDLETLTAKVTYCSLKKEDVVPERPVFLMDIMLASGSSGIVVIDELKKLGVGRIYMGTVISTEYGISRIQESHPDVTHFTCVIDPRLDKRGYILPGLGDAGDRQFGTI